MSECIRYQCGTSIALRIGTKTLMVFNRAKLHMMSSCCPLDLIYYNKNFSLGQNVYMSANMLQFLKYNFNYFKQGCLYIFFHLKWLSEIS